MPGTFDRPVWAPRLSTFSLIVVGVARVGDVGPLGRVGGGRQRSIGGAFVASGEGPADASVSDRTQFAARCPGVGRGQLLALLDGQMQLGRQTAARASKAVVVRLRRAYPAGWLLLQIPLFRAPAACWWARHTVESTLMSQVMSSLASART